MRSSRPWMRRSAGSTNSTSSRRPALGVDQRRRSLLAVVCVVLQHPDPEPAPVDAMALDQAVRDFHHFGEVHLLAAGRFARVFPEQRAAVSQVAGAVVAAGAGLALRELLEERPQLVVAVQDAAFGLHEVRHERAFERRVGRIQREKTFGVALRVALVPLAVDALDRVHGLTLALRRSREMPIASTLIERSAWTRAAPGVRIPGCNTTGFPPLPPCSPIRPTRRSSSR